MKLYQQYCKIIDQIKPVKRAWFTTFNLDMELVERFLLSKLVDKSPQELKTAEDYEALNLDLQAIDVKVWYDYRAINLKSPKLTTADFLSVDPRNFHSSASQDIVFHPKIAFLIGEGGAYLMAGSANLSIAAWSSNRESVLAKAVNTRINAGEILAFFERLFQASGLSTAVFGDLRRWGNRFPDEASGWRFIDSITDTAPLFDHLEKGTLTVWSPYFARNTSGLLDKLRQIGYPSIQLVPDISMDGKVRIVPEEVEKIQEQPFVKIYKSRAVSQDMENLNRLSHAKVWLSGKTLAIGSWNCSFAATGLDKPAQQRNIEAGIIAPVPGSVMEALLADLESVDSRQIKGVSGEDLDRDWEASLNNYSEECRVQADWATFTYHILSTQERLKEHMIILPDRPTEKIPFLEAEGRSFRENFRKVLKNKNFTVYNYEDQEVFSGFLVESNTDKRQAYGYSTLFDLFDSLLYNPMGETARRRCQYRLPEEEDGLERPDDLVFTYKGHESYYMMFVAFQKLSDSIQENKGRSVELDRIGFRLQGSLINISELVRESIKTLEDKIKKEWDEDSCLFHYFLASELNRSIDEFNSSTGKDVHKIPVEHLLEKLNPTKEDFEFLKKLKDQFGYSNV